MNRDEILELLLKDKFHDELIERPELYSIEEDIYQWMFETRDYWNEKIPKIMEHEKRFYEELKRDEPEYYWQYEAKYDTEENYRKNAYRYYRLSRGFHRGSLHWEISWFWRKLLPKRPEFAARCPWNSFRGDQIWWTLGDDEFCNAIGIPKKELALKMPLKIMSRCDWDELLKIVPRAETRAGQASRRRIQVRGTLPIGDCRMESLTQEQILEQVVKRDKPGKITENTFSESEPLTHHSTQNRGRCCLVCKHWTAHRDLRQERRWLVVLENGHCRFGERMCVEGHSIGELQHWPHSCRHACLRFEKILELRARNMTLLQRSYARMPPCKTSRRLTCEKTHDECPLAGCVCKTKKHSTVENTQITKEKHK